MAVDLTGTVVIVTGAAGGLGSVMSLGLIAAGASVAAIDLPRADARMAELVAAARQQDAVARLRPFHCDVTSPAQCDGAVAAAAAQFGALHGLVNCAALGPYDLEDAEPGRRRKFFEIDIELWRGRVETNLIGPFIMARTVAPRLIARGGGKIVNVTTSFSTMVGGGHVALWPDQGGAGGGDVGLGEGFEGTGVTVNVLIPGGAADTRMVPPEAMPDRASLVQPVAMVAPIQWLMSRHSDGVTGRRFIGKNWDPALDPAQAAAAAGAPAAW